MEISGSDVGTPAPAADVHPLLLDDVRRGLADIEVGRTVEADEAISRIQRRRAAAAIAQDELRAD